MRFRHKLLATSLHTTPETIIAARMARRPLTNAGADRHRGRELKLSAPVVPTEQA